VTLKTGMKQYNSLQNLERNTTLQKLCGS
jgi:hypothetical protein